MSKKFINGNCGSQIHICGFLHQNNFSKCHLLYQIQTVLNRYTGSVSFIEENSKSSKPVDVSMKN